MKDPNFNISEIEKAEEIKERLREEFKKEFGFIRSENFTVESSDWVFDWFIERMNLYAQQKIDQIFKEENEKSRYERPCKNCGKINRTRSSVCEKCCPSKL